jgi:hypothetical protein
MKSKIWVLNWLDELTIVYLEVKICLTLLLRLFHIMKKDKLINQKRYSDHVEIHCL